MSRPGADFLFRYPTFWLPDNNEYLYDRFQWMADAKVDPITNISTIEVNAFSAEDAKAIVVAMLGYAEALVNQMNERAYNDGLTNADRFVAEAQKRLDAVEDALQAYRNASGSVDPNLVAQSKLKVIEGLSTELAHIEATIAQQTAIAPTSPSLAGLRAQAESFRKEIEKRKLEIAGSAGSEAVKLEQYEKLVLQRDLAAKALGAAEAERNLARQDTERQHLYVQLISRPNLSARFRPISEGDVGSSGAPRGLPRGLPAPAPARRDHRGASRVTGHSDLATIAGERPEPPRSQNGPGGQRRREQGRSGWIGSRRNTIPKSASGACSTASRSNCAKARRSPCSGATVRASRRW